MARPTKTISALMSASGVGGVGYGIPVGQHKDHGLDLLVGNQVVDDHVSRTVPRPLPVFVATDAVQQEQNGILLVSG